jgi:type 1 fimbria pilin
MTNCSNTKIKIAIASMILAIALVFPSNSILANTTSKATTIDLTGTIRKIAVEGTCFQLAADNGKKYELIGKFPRRDGVKVRVSGVVATDIATICQVGQPFKIKSIRVIK